MYARWYRTKRAREPPPPYSDFVTFGQMKRGKGAGKTGKGEKGEYVIHQPDACEYAFIWQLCRIARESPEVEQEEREERER